VRTHTDDETCTHTTGCKRTVARIVDWCTNDWQHAIKGGYYTSVYSLVFMHGTYTDNWSTERANEITRSTGVHVRTVSGKILTLTGDGAATGAQGGSSSMPVGAHAYTHVPHVAAGARRRVRRRRTTGAAAIHLDRGHHLRYTDCEQEQ